MPIVSDINRRFQLLVICLFCVVNAFMADPNVGYTAVDKSYSVVARSVSAFFAQWHYNPFSIAPSRTGPKQTSFSLRIQHTALRKIFTFNVTNASSICQQRLVYIVLAVFKSEYVLFGVFQNKLPLLFIYTLLNFTAFTWLPARTSSWEFTMLVWRSTSILSNKRLNFIFFLLFSLDGFFSLPSFLLKNLLKFFYFLLEFY